MFKALLSIQMQTTLHGLTAATRKRHLSGKAQAALLLVLLPLLGLSLGFMFFGIFSVLALPFYEAGLSQAYFSLYFLLLFGIMFLGSVFMTKSRLFEARDNELLLSLPVPVRTILLSRMVSLILTNCAYGATVAIPAALAWLWVCPVTAGGAAAFVLITLAMPLFSVAVSSVFGWLLALLARRIRRKNLFSIAFYLAFLFGYFWFMNRMNDGVLQMAAHSRELAGFLGSVAPLHLLGAAVTGSGALHIAGALAMLLLPFAAALGLLGLGFRSIALPGTAGKKKAYRHGAQRTSGLDWALCLREAKRFFSSANYVMNAGLGAVFALAACVLLILKRADLAALLEQAAQIPGLAGYLPAAMATGLCALSCGTCISASSVSIDGKTLWILRTAPVPPEKILTAKLRLHLCLSAPALLPLQAAAAWVLHADAAGTAMLLLLPQAFNLLIAEIGLAANLKFPRLDWIHETQVVKNGAPVAIAMFGGWGLSIALGAAIYPLSLLIPAAWAGIAAGCGVLAAALLLRRWILTKGAAIYSRL